MLMQLLTWLFSRKIKKVVTLPEACIQQIQNFQTIFTNFFESFVWDSLSNTDTEMTRSQTQIKFVDCFLRLLLISASNPSKSGMLEPP